MITSVRPGLPHIEHPRPPLTVRRQRSKAKQSKACLYTPHFPMKVAHGKTVDVPSVGFETWAAGMYRSPLPL